MSNLTEDQIIVFLVEYFKEKNIITEINEWHHIRDNRMYGESYVRCTFRHSILGYVEIKKEYEKLDVDIDTLSCFRHSTLSNNLDIIKQTFKLVLDEYKNPNVGYLSERDHNLYNSSSIGNLEAVKFLVESGVQISVEGETNFIGALLNNHYHIIQYFLEKCPQINQDVAFNHPDITDDMINKVKKINLFNDLEKNITSINIEQKKIKI